MKTDDKCQECKKDWTKCAKCPVMMKWVVEIEMKNERQARDMMLLPSVTPSEMQEPKYCDRNICLSNEYNDISCDECEVMKSQEPCKDCISRQAALDAIGNVPDYDDGMVWEALSHAQRDVALLPPVTPAEKVGRWIMHIDDLFPADSTMECNKCHEHQPITIDDNYCPNCGAKMEAEK